MGQDKEPSLPGHVTLGNYLSELWLTIYKMHILILRAAGNVSWAWSLKANPKLCGAAKNRGFDAACKNHCVWSADTNYKSSHKPRLSKVFTRVVQLKRVQLDFWIRVCLISKPTATNAGRYINATLCPITRQIYVITFSASTQSSLVQNNLSLFFVFLPHNSHLG